MKVYDVRREQQQISGVAQKISSNSTAAFDHRSYFDDVNGASTTEGDEFFTMKANIQAEPLQPNFVPLRKGSMYDPPTVSLQQTAHQVPTHEF